MTLSSQGAPIPRECFQQTSLATSLINVHHLSANFVFLPFGADELMVYSWVQLQRNSKMGGEYNKP